MTTVSANRAKRFINVFVHYHTFRAEEKIRIPRLMQIFNRV